MSDFWVFLRWLVDHVTFFVFPGTRQNALHNQLALERMRLLRSQKCGDRLRRQRDEALRRAAEAEGILQSAEREVDKLNGQIGANKIEIETLINMHGALNEMAKESAALSTMTRTRAKLLGGQE